MGLTVSEIAGFMSVAVIGGAVAQLPLGRLSDRIDRRYVMIGLSLSSVAIGTLLSGVVPIDGLAVLVVAFFFGAALLPAYTVAAAHVFDHADQSMMVEVSAGLLLVNGLGSVFGPIIASAAMQTLGAGALFGFIAVTHILLAAYLVVRRKKRVAPAESEKTDFKLSNVAPVVSIADAEAIEESPLVVTLSEPEPREGG